MSFYEPPTENLAIFDPSVFTSNDEPLTIATGSKYFLRFPYAQNTENLQAINVNGVATFNSTSEFKRPLNMSSTVSSVNRTVASSYYNFYDSNVAGSLNQNGTLYNSNGSMYLQNTTNSGSINFVLNDGAGVQKIPIQMLNSGTNFNASCNFLQDVTLTNSKTLGITSASAIRFFAGSFCDYLSGTNSTYRSGSSLIMASAPITQTGTSTNTMNAITVNSNNNLEMPAGTGAIIQTITAGDNSTVNRLKKTIITTNNATAGGDTCLDMYDTPSGRGILIFPNVGTANQNLFTQLNDSVISARSPSNNCALTLTLPSPTFYLGMRMAVTSGTTGNITLRAGSNIVTLDASSSLLINNTVTFNGSTGASRQIQNLGTLTFTELTSGITTSTIYTDATAGPDTLYGMYYDCSINGGNHMFKINGSGGAKTIPFTISSTLTSTSNTLTVRNATTTSNRLDIDTNNSQKSTLRARSATASTNAQIEINCDTVSAGAVISTNNVMNIEPFTIKIKRPLEMIYTTTPSISSQLGYTNSQTISDLARSTQASPYTLASDTLPSAGTWQVTAHFNFQTTGNNTYTTFSYAIGSANNAFPATLPYTITYMREPNTVINNTEITRQISMTIQVTTGTTIYFTEQVAFGGGGTTNIGLRYSYTRVG